MPESTPNPAEGGGESMGDTMEVYSDPNAPPEPIEEDTGAQQPLPKGGDDPPVDPPPGGGGTGP